MAFPTQTIIVAGVFRSGQTWLCYLLSASTKYLFIEPYCFLRGINHSQNHYINSHCWSNNSILNGLVIKTHEYPDPYSDKDIYKIVIFRDPLETINSEINRRKTVVRNLTDVDVVKNDIKIIINFKIIKRILLSYLQPLLIFGLAIRWGRFYSEWVEFDKSGNIIFLNYEQLTKNKFFILNNLLNSKLKLKIKEEKIKDILNILSKKNMEDEAKKKFFQEISLGSKTKHKFNFLEKFLISKITNKAYKNCLLKSRKFD